MKDQAEERLQQLMVEAEQVFANRAKAEQWMSRRSRVLDAVPKDLGRTEEGARRVRAELSAIAHGDVA
jgi:uncharacterized protein (DUF2384 family)